jgi:hypothetical protein
MKKCSLFRKHNWITVAIDTSNGWRKLGPDKEVLYNADHIIEFMCCKTCGARKIGASDATEEGIDFALTRNKSVALQRTIWEASGKITGYDDDCITWVDSSYAPLGSIDDYINAIKKDKDFKELMKSHSMVDDAMGQLEVAIKLCNNNPQGKP